MNVDKIRRSIADGVGKLRHSSSSDMDNFGYRDPFISQPIQKPSFFKSSITRRRESELLPLNTRRIPPDLDLLERSPPERDYLFVGPSPPAEDAPNLSHGFDDVIPDPEAKPTEEILRQSLYERASVLGIERILDDIECCNIAQHNATDFFSRIKDVNILNFCLLWAAFIRKDELLPVLVEFGAEVDYADQNGFTALHYSAFGNTLEGASYLISQGAHIDYVGKFFAPIHCAAFGNSFQVAQLLIDQGVSLDVVVNRPGCEDNVVQCAVRADADYCLELFLHHGVDPGYTTSNGFNALHLAAELGSYRCLAFLLKNTNLKSTTPTFVRDKETTALHLAAAGGHSLCVDLLLAEGANSNAVNYRGFTPLHLAARCSSMECVEALLKDGNANPNAEDYDKRTPLHAAISRSDRACDVIEILASWGSDINKRDDSGYTALHLAALDGLSQCVETLIYHGADVTTKSKKGNSALNVITRKTPGSLKMISHTFDTSITLHQSRDVNEEVRLELDFGRLLKYSHPREITYLNNLVEEGQKEFLIHPLCSAFLFMKWHKIRKYYVARLIFCFIFVLVLSLYVLTALVKSCKGKYSTKYGVLNELCQKSSMLGSFLKQNPLEPERILLVTITVFEIIRKLLGITGYSSLRHYLTTFENLMEWFVLLSVFFVYDIDKEYSVQDVIGGFAVLCAWTNLMLMMGQLPMFGDYVAMYQKIQCEFAKLFLAYVCVLFGFTVSFCIIFPNEEMFSNPFMGFISVLTMMVGELNLNILINDPNAVDPPLLFEVSAQVTFILFLVFVTIILMNLLVGIAVHDIQGLRKTAGISKLVRHVKLILFVELGLFSGLVPKCIRSCIYKSALVSPGAGKFVISVKPLNPAEKRLPRDIMMAAYGIAQKNLIDPPMTAKEFVKGSPKRDEMRHSKTDQNMDVVLTDMQQKLDLTSFHVQKIDQDVRDMKEMFLQQKNFMVKILEEVKKDRVIKSSKVESGGV